MMKTFMLNIEEFNLPQQSVPVITNFNHQGYEKDILEGLKCYIPNLEGTEIKGHISLILVSCLDLESGGVQWILHFEFDENFHIYAFKNILESHSMETIEGLYIPQYLINVTYNTLTVYHEVG